MPITLAVELASALADFGELLELQDGSQITVRFSTDISDALGVRSSSHKIMGLAADLASLRRGDLVKRVSSGETFRVEVGDVIQTRGYALAYLAPEE